MGLTALAIYVLGALIMHFIIYGKENEEMADPASTNLACVLWPISVVLYCIISIENLFKEMISK